MRDFAFLLANAGGAVPKMCIPSPAILHLVLAVRDEHFRLPAFYADEDDFMESLAAAYRKAIRAFYRMRRKTPPFRAGDIRRVRRICVSN